MLTNHPRGTKCCRPGGTRDAAVLGPRDGRMSEKRAVSRMGSATGIDLWTEGGQQVHALSTQALTEKGKL